MNDDVRIGLAQTMGTLTGFLGYVRLSPCEAGDEA
jgi:hypothetical protein